MKSEIEENWMLKMPEIPESVDKLERLESPLISETDANASFGPHSGVHAKSSSLERAERIRANLSPQFPSFLKILRSSHTSRRLYLPREFCKKQLKNESTVILVDENGQAYKTNYATNSYLLNGEWRRFFTAHKLAGGDILVFHLVEPYKFKVYIVRAVEANETPDLLYKAANANPIKTDDSGRQTKFSESILKFEDVKCFEDFKISVGDIIIDSEIPTDARKRYYELCCSQNMFLHDHLIEGLSSNLAATIISETVSIVDALKASNITATSLDHLKCWDKTLKGFRAIGMSVGFLHTRLNKLIKLSRESQAIVLSKKKKRIQLDEEMGTLMAAVKKVKGIMNNLETEVEAVEVKNEKLGSEFMELAGAT